MNVDLAPLWGKAQWGDVHRHRLLAKMQGTDRRDWRVAVAHNEPGENVTEQRVLWRMPVSRASGWSAVILAYGAWRSFGASDGTGEALVLTLVFVLPLAALSFALLRRPALVLDGDHIRVRGVIGVRSMRLAEFDRLVPEPRKFGLSRLISVSGQSLPFFFGPSTFSEARVRLAEGLRRARSELEKG